MQRRCSLKGVEGAFSPLTAVSLKNLRCQIFLSVVHFSESVLYDRYNTAPYLPNFVCQISFGYAYVPMMGEEKEWLLL